MPTTLEMWLYAIPIATIGFLLGRFRWWLGVTVLTWPILLVFGGAKLYLYDFVGESLLYTNNSAYFVSVVFSVILVVTATFYGIRTGQGKLRFREPHDAA